MTVFERGGILGLVFLVVLGILLVYYSKEHERGEEGVSDQAMLSFRQKGKMHTS